LLRHARTGGEVVVMSQLTAEPSQIGSAAVKSRDRAITS
jgi:hypothetical protein